MAEEKESKNKEQDAFITNAMQSIETLREKIYSIASIDLKKYDELESKCKFLEEKIESANNNLASQGEWFNRYSEIEKSITDYLNRTEIPNLTLGKDETLLPKEMILKKQFDSVISTIDEQKEKGIESIDEFTEVRQGLDSKIEGLNPLQKQTYDKKIAELYFSLQMHEVISKNEFHLRNVSQFCNPKSYEQVVREYLISKIHENKDNKDLILLNSSPNFAQDIESDDFWKKLIGNPALEIVRHGEVIDQNEDAGKKQEGEKQEETALAVVPKKQNVFLSLLQRFSGKQDQREIIISYMDHAKKGDWEEFKRVTKKVKISLVNGEISPREYSKIYREIQRNARKVDRINIKEKNSEEGSSTDENLTVIFPEGLKKLPDGFFRKSHLPNVNFYIPKSLKVIGKECFREAVFNYIGFISKEELRYQFGEEAVKSYIDSDPSLEIIDDYAFSQSEFEYSDPNIFAPNLSIIGDYAFSSSFKTENMFNYYKKDMFANTSLRKIGKYAFCQCIGNFPEDTLLLPKTLEEVGENAFYKKVGDQYIVSQVEGGKLKKIGAHAFSIERCDESKPVGSKATSNLDLSEATYIGLNAFRGSYLPDNIELGDDLQVLGDGVFAYTRGVKKCTISEKISQIPQELFRNSSIQAVKSNGNLSSIGESAFQDCEDLKGFESKDIDYIGNNAFSNCNSLELFVANSVKRIGDEAFSKCQSLKLFNGRFTEYVGRKVFDGCESLRIAIFPKLINLYPGTFLECPNIEEMDFSSLRTNRVLVSKYEGKGVFSSLNNLKKAILSKEILDANPALAKKSGIEIITSDSSSLDKKDKSHEEIPEEFIE